MRFTRVPLRVDDPASALVALAGLLDAPVQGDAVRVGWTAVVPVQRGASEGVDHLAVLVPADGFADARAWLVARTPLLGADGRTDFEGPAAWGSRSVYADGPGGSVLELIAHAAHPSARGAGPFGGADLLGVCEVGVAVPSVPAAVEALGAEGVTPFAGTASEGFAATGGLEARLILVPPGRPWLPTPDRLAGAAPLRIEAEGGPAAALAVGDARLVPA